MKHLMAILRLSIFTSLLFVLTLSPARAERTYTESGLLRCAAQSSTNGTPIVVFVNGILNSLDNAETSRDALSRAMLQKCPTCEFKKVYNQTDGEFDDLNELATVGSWQMRAIDKASVAQFDFLVQQVPEIIRVLRQAGYTSFRGYSLDQLQTELRAWLVLTRNTARDGYRGNAVRYYDPLTEGTSFTAAQIADIAATIERDATSRLAVALTVYQQYLTVHKEALDSQFFLKYRSILFSTYYSDRNLYLTDAAAVGAVTKSVESLVTFVTEYVLAGHSVVLVPHSQGNHIAELAYSALQSRQSAEFMRALRVVGVASVSSSTPNNVYITWEEDHTVLTLHSLGRDRPLAPNFTDERNFLDPDVEDDFGDHNFIKIYLSSMLRGKYTLPSNAQTSEVFSSALRDSSQTRTAVDVLTDLISASVLAANSVPATISTRSLLTAQLRWEDYRDMDLQIQEPDGRFVFFGRKAGTYGYLDLDDTNGDGPEHYFLRDSTTCDDLAGKEWKFFVHQYPRGGSKAVAHLMLKVGNSAYLSRSFGLTSWPSQPILVGTVRFERVTPMPNTVRFVILVTDPSATPEPG